MHFLFKKLRAIIRWILVAFFGSTILAVVALRFFPVYFTPLMFIRCYEQVKEGRELKLSHHWVSIDKISPNLPKAVMTGNIHYIDKTMQQALIPRSILLVLTFFFSVLMTIVSYLWSIKWWVLFLVICLSIYIAIPRKMRNSALFGKIFSTVKLVWLMLKNILKMDLKSKEFLHTTHGK